MIQDTSGQDTVITSNKRGPSKLVIAVVGAVVAIGGFYALSGQSSGSANSSYDRSRISTAVVTKGTFIKDISAQGEIVAAVSPTLYASGSGIITLHVKAGKTVKKGDVLAEIDSPDLRTKLAQEQALLDSLRADISRLKIEQKKSALSYQQQIEVAELDLKAADREMNRAEKSMKSTAISDLDYQKARDILERAKVDFRHIKQQAELSSETVAFELETKQLEIERQSLLVQEYERRVELLKVRSTVNGIVARLDVEQKANVVEHTPLLTIVDLTEFEVEINVAETHASELGLGMPVNINFKNELYKGEVVAISPEVKDNQVAARVKFTEKAPSSLRQSQRVSTRILVEEKANALKVKRGNFVESGNYSVYVVDGDIATKRRVQLGSKSVSEVEILSGLKAGEQIVISSTREFKGVDSIYLR